VRRVLERIVSLRNLFPGKARQPQLAPLTPLLHLCLNRLGPVGIEPAPRLQIRRLRRQGQAGSRRGDDVHDAQVQILGDFQILAEVHHGDVAEHLEIQR
jgi:hypothetical protein